ncbi:hypothetical protein FOL47_010442 [Perkinsus chesapeaki]|uniref:nucleoside-diphosphate kinase n=1 Tax=Perkinsus chesapeaki TaxID=330153 RepID=A0A7J6L1T2_PERCH|nr:hypothetical protein FOL47_010442 [Perkinsus chesapeaki]
MSTPSRTDRTFIMVKPDGVQRGLVGRIIQRFEDKGFKLVAMKMCSPSEDHFKKHYADLVDKPFFAGLVKYMQTSPVVAMVWEGLDAAAEGRRILGATKPSESAPGTIRGDFGLEVGRNLIHGSDSPDSAAKEIALWFPEGVNEWKKCDYHCQLRGAPSLRPDKSSVASGAEASSLSGWSDSGVEALFAVGVAIDKVDTTKGFEVVIFNVEGVKVPVTPRLLRRSGAVTTLLWKPCTSGSAVLIISWSDGTLQRVEVPTAEIRAAKGNNIVVIEKALEASSHIVTSVSCPEGRSLATASSDGSLALWDTAGPGQLDILHKVSSRIGVAKRITFRTRDPSKPDRPSYVFAAESGSICSVSSRGMQVDYKIPGPVSFLSYLEEEDTLVILSVSGILARFRIDSAGKMIDDLKMKLSAANPSKTRCCWAGSGLLVTVSEEPFVRLWKLRSSGESKGKDQTHYLMALQDEGIGPKLAKDVAVSIAYDPDQMVLACGTAKGYVVRWRCLEQSTVTATDSSWELMPLIEIPGHKPLGRISWCRQAASSSASVLSVGVSDAQSGLIAQWLVLENAVRWSTLLPRLAIQTAIDAVAVIDSSSGSRSILDCTVSDGIKLHLKGITLLETFLVCWSHDTLLIFTLTSDKAKLASTIPIQSMVTATAWAPQQTADGDDVRRQLTLTDITLVIAYPRRLAFLSGDGSQKKEIPYITTTDGAPRAMVCSPSGHLVVVSDKNILRVWDIGATAAQPKPLGPPRRVGGDEENFGMIESVKVNCSGTKVSMLTQQRQDDGDSAGEKARHQIDHRVLFYDIIHDMVSSKDCVASDVLYTPVAHMWDHRDPRVMACEGRNAVPRNRRPAKEEVSGSTVRINTLLVFILDNSGSGQVVLQGTHPCRFTAGPVPGVPVGISTPYIYLYNQAETRFDKVCQRSFLGMESACDGPRGATTAKALVDFSFYLAKGNADAAYRAVRSVESLSVWENLCRMAVKTRQLHVARRCLGRIQVVLVAAADKSGTTNENSNGNISAAALRASFTLRDGEVRADFATEEEELAAIAVHLGMTEEADELYREATSNYFGLNKLYQRLGRWSDAVVVAEVHDRMHLPSTHFARARSLEAKGDVTGALKNYEEAGAAGLSEVTLPCLRDALMECAQIPRMFLRFGLVQPLKDYIDKAGKPELYKWYGSYAESLGGDNAEAAEEYYRKAKDWSTLVRLAWAKSDIDGARRLCRESNDSNAKYQHAKYLQHHCSTIESVDKEQLLKEAVKCYSSAGRIGAALRLAQTYDMEAELMQLSMEAVYSEDGDGGTATAGAMQAARLYESKRDYARAAALYHKIGQTDKAIALCLSTRQYDALRKIADYLTPDNTDPETLERCAKILIEKEYVDKAVQLMASSDQLEKAVAMCEEYNVPITEDLADRLTPKDRDHPKYKDLLISVGNLAKKNGLYAVACKKFTQAGDKIRAMKALLRSGDTERIVFYAQTARTKEVYILAANSLQSLDWYKNEELEKNIVSFYTRAKATDQLIRFHELRAHSAIDERQDVEGAIRALGDALAVIDKNPAGSATAETSNIKSSLGLLEKFAEAKRSAQTDPRASLVACGGLLQSVELKSSPLRAGDVQPTKWIRYVIRYAFMAHLFHTNGQTSDAAEVVKRMIQQNITPSVYVPRELLREIGFGGLPDESSNTHEAVEEEIVEDIGVA